MWDAFNDLLSAVAPCWVYQNTRHWTTLHDPQRESTNIRHSSSPSERLIDALRQIISNPSETINQLRVAEATTARGITLAQLQGYVKISDLVDYPDLETSLINFVNLTQDFDSNTLRLENAYNSTISHLRTFITTFCLDLHKLLEEAKAHLCPDVDFRRRQHPRYESSNVMLQRQILRTQLNESSSHVSVFAAVLIQAISTLFEDTVTEIDTYFDLHRHKRPASSNAYSTPPSTPTTSNNHPRASNPPIESPITTLLERLASLPTSHPLHTTLKTSVQSIITTTAELQPVIFSMQEFFFDIDDTLHDLIDEVKGLSIETLGVKVGQIIAVMGRLNGIVRNAKERGDVPHV